jgi:hypothetical protein
MEIVNKIVMGEVNKVEMENKKDKKNLEGRGMDTPDDLQWNP